MKFELLILVLNFYLAHSFLFSSNGDAPNWNDLKVTWGINPFSSSNFVSLPRTENEAKSKGWIKEKGCSDGVNGNRYLLNGDRAAMLVFNAQGIIAGIAASIPKGLPFNFPSTNQRRLLNDEGSFYSITAYFVDPNSVCSAQKSAKQVTGDRLIFKGSSMELNVALEEQNLSNFWSKGKCFYTMGQHYWANINGVPLAETISPDDFTPIFLLYNKGKLNGFGWAFNADLSSTRYEHPPTSALDKFFNSIPKFFTDPTKSGVLSTLHIYLDNTPQLNFC